MGDGQGEVVTRSELLRRRETMWRPMLGEGSLVAEFTGAPPADTEQVLGALGYQYQRGYGAQRAAILRRYPAVHVIAMSQAATEHYEAGGFWGSLCELAGIHNEGPTQQEWGSAFIGNLETLGLPTFEDESDRGARFVGRILMHSGVPTYCLGDYFRIVSERRRMTPGIDPLQFVEWATERARLGRLANVDKPVQRFLRYGGEFAVDVTDRVFELLDIIGSGGTGDDVPLPARFAEAARWLRDNGSIDIGGGTHRGRQAASQPHLHLDPYGRGPVLRLPAVGDTADGTVTWIVTMDGHEERVQSSALWPGFHEPTPQVDVPLARPVRSALAALPGHESLVFSTPVVDDADPLLAFGEEGRMLRTSLPLPGAAVWLLFPGSREVDLTTQGEASLLAEGVLPPGWAGWSLVLVDLATVSSLRVGGGPRHVVRSGAEARIVMPDPVPAVRTLDGDLVFADPPRIQLPPGAEGVEWTAVVQNEKGDVLTRMTPGADGDPGALWGALDRPAHGRFILKVRGPWGRGAVRRFTIIEGLRVEAVPSWRRMTGRGLVPATVTIAVPDSFTAGPETLHFDTRAVTRPVMVDCGPESMRLSVEVPHMAVSHVCEAQVSKPSVTSLRLFTEDVLEDPGSVVLDVGVGAEPVLHVLTADGEVQLVRPKGGSRGQAYRFDLREVTDTLTAHRSLQISLDRAADLIIATVRPRQLFTEMRMKHDRLVLDDCVAIEGLTALCYSAMAPWRPPVSVAVREGEAVLPQSLVGVGSLLVSVRIDDPWVPEPMPPWPRPRSSRFVEADGYVMDGDESEVAVSALLAGADSLPQSFVADHRTWDTLDRMWSLHLGERFTDVQEQLQTAVTAVTDRSLLALLGSAARVDRMPFLLIRSGLAWSPMGSPETLEGPPPWTRRSALPLTLLGAWDQHSADSMQSVIAVCGDDFPEVMAGRDPHAVAGRFDEVIDRLATMPHDVRESIMASAGLVPHALLHQDSRALAAKQLLDDRENDDLRWLRWKAQVLLRDLEETLGSAGFEAGLGAVTARRHPTADHGWRVLPAWSMAMAITARLVARGDIDACRLSSDARRAWEDLSTVAPNLVTVDLVLAELLVRSHLPTQQEHS